MVFDIVVGRNESDLEKFGSRGTIFLGKNYVKMGQTTSLSNKILMDVATSHVILCCGKRGSGKCLHGDTLITLCDGSVKPIKDLEHDQNDILTLDDKLKISPAKKTEFFKRKVKKLIKLKFRSGKEIKLTPEHPLLTIKGWKALNELSLGSRIATPRVVDVSGNNKMHDHEVRLLAYLIAEGHTKKIVLFANSDKEIVEEFRSDLYRLDPSSELIEDKENHYRVSNPNWKNVCLDSSKMIFDRKKGRWAKGSKIILKKRRIREFIEKNGLFGKLSIEKEIPQSILNLNRSKLSLFLNRLFSCDGSIYYNGNRNGWEIDYSSSSKKLISGVQHLLLRFEVLSRLREKKIKCNNKIFKSFELVISSKNIQKFIENIGFFGDKEKKAEKCLNEIRFVKRNPNVDTIPKEIWDTYKPKNWAEIGRYFGYAHPKAMRERIKYSPSRQTLLQIAKADNQESLKLLAESDIFWDEIMAMETLEGDFEVYDLCVPDTHNFIANDIIVHNSYSLSVIAEEMVNLPEEISKNLAIIMIDTMGIFWTMKYPNHRDEKLLAEWDLKPKGMDINLYVPEGFFKKYKDRGLLVDKPFSIKTSELNAADWSDVFNIKLTSPIGVLLERVIAGVKELYGNDYGIEEILRLVKKNKTSLRSVKNAVENRFLNASEWGLFSKEGTEIKELAKGGEVTILDVSPYTHVAGSWSIKNLVIGMVARKLLVDRMSSRIFEELDNIETRSRIILEEKKLEKPLVWIFLDEAHESIGRTGKTPATDALVQLLREGRQPGVSLVLATQQPGEIHKDVLTQSDIVLSHRLTAQVDIEALNSMMQSYLLADIQTYMNGLPRLKGSAILLDDNSERMYPMRVRPKMSWHGGEAPSAIKYRKKEEIEKELGFEI